MSYYPIILDLTAKRCLVVGGGAVAYRKVHRLAEVDADLTVIAPDIDPRIRDIHGITILERSFVEGDTAGFALVFAASDDWEVNAAVAREADDNAILVNAVDDPDRCTFIAPAVVQHGDVMIAISTSGKSPALSHRLREDIEKAYGPEYGELADLLGSLRPVVKSKYSSQTDREAAFNRLMDGGILELIREGKREEAREKALECI